jgi:serine/threonine-protein kinase
MTRAWLTLVCVLGLAAAVAADPVPPKPPSAAAKARARDHFKKGQAFHASGDYDQAIVEYQAAYAEAPLPDLLFNLAQVQRLKGDKRQALDNYLLYLEQAPNGRGADESRQWVTTLSRDIRADEAERRRREEAEAAERRQREAAEAAEAQRRVEEARRAEAQAAAPSAPGSSLRVAGLVTGGAGIVALGLGTYFGLHAKSLSDQQHGLTEFDPGLVSDGNAANRNAILSFTIGGAALAAGGVLYYLGVRAGREVVVTPTVAGVAVGGRF